MGSAKRDGELVADFSSQGSRLSEFQVMRISGGLLADQTTLTANEAEVILASSPRRLFRKARPTLLADKVTYVQSQTILIEVIERDGHDVFDYERASQRAVGLGNTDRAAV